MPTSNLIRLAIEFMSVEAIPAGCENPLASAVNFIMSLKTSGAGKRAQQRAQEAVDLVKMSKDNPYGNDDEAIAAVILAKIAERKAQQRQKLVDQQRRKVSAET